MPNAVFVCGATGTQGGAVARHLRHAGIPVHALVRDLGKASHLRDIGVTIFPGSYDDDTALRGAINGCTSAFLNFTPSFTDFDEELRHAKAVLAASRDARAQHVVYSSSFGLDEKKNTRPGLDPDGMVAKVYQVKRNIIREVVSFDSYTILRPAKFMTDLIGHRAAWFGDLARTGIFETALRQGEASPYVDPNDIGAFAAAALLDPKKFAGHRVDMFTAMLTPEELISMLANTTGRKMSVHYLSGEELEEKKKTNLFLEAQITMRDTSAMANMDLVRSWGVPLGSFRAFLEREKNHLDETYAQLAPGP